MSELLRLGISAAPVVDAERRPIGVTTLRDLMRATGEPEISSPAITVSSTLLVEEAARMMADGEHHHLVVVGSDGRVVGMLSSLDLIRALVGMPPRYPPAFPHRDAFGVAWTDLVPFDAAHVESSPAGSGVLVLSTGGVGHAECDLWVEAAYGLRARLGELLAGQGQSEAAAAAVFGHEGLHFRAASIGDGPAREVVARRLSARIAAAPFPHDTAPTDD